MSLTNMQSIFNTPSRYTTFPSLCSPHASLSSMVSLLHTQRQPMFWYQIPLISFAYSWIEYKWNCKLYILLCPNLLNLVFLRFIHVTLYNQKFSPFHCWAVFHLMNFKVLYVCRLHYLYILFHNRGEPSNIFINVGEEIGFDRLTTNGIVLSSAEFIK